MRYTHILIAAMLGCGVLQAGEKSTVDKHLQEIITEHGKVPAPWEYLSGVHPYSIGWRMGSGESYLMSFWPWWQKQNFSKEQKVQFFLQRNPPPAWLLWVAQTINDEAPSLSISLEEQFENQRDDLISWGFKGVDDFASDFADPKWK